MNYWNYFTEIEEHFQRARGTALMISTLDWALVETWKDAGIPLAAVLRGIDVTFEKFQKRPQVFRKVNSLAYCSQAVLEAAEQMKEAAVGGETAKATEPAGLDRASVAAYLRHNRDALKQRAEDAPARIAQLLGDSAASLDEIALQLETGTTPSMEDVERRLTVLEEKINAALLGLISEADLLAVRSEAERDLAPYRRQMTGPQIEQLHRQYVSKRLLERWKLPRLSLFYM